MSTATNREDILKEHASLIHLVVSAVGMPDIRPQLDQQLALAESNGWHALVAAIRGILGGERDITALGELDEEDSVIVQAILDGLKDPAVLPGLAGAVDPDVAGPAIARLVVDTAAGVEGAAEAFEQVMAQLAQAGPELAAVAERVRRMVQGERDAAALTAGLEAPAARLAGRVLDELGRAGA